MKHDYTVVYQTIEDGDVMARVPELPGAVVHAPTIEAARAMIRRTSEEVLFTYLRDARTDAGADATWETLSLEIPENWNGPAERGNLQMTRLPISDERLAAFCRENHIRKLSLFGSYLKGTARPDSDIDLLVEFEPDQSVSLFTVVETARELSRLVGRKVDLRTPGELSHYFRDEVVHTAKLLYAR